MSRLDNPLLRSSWVTLVVFTFSLIADQVFRDEGLSRRDLILLGDTLAAVACGALYWLYARREQERRRTLEARLRLAAEMNHHIRNALQTLVYVQSLETSKYSAMTSEAVKRIEWALNEVLSIENSEGSAELVHTSAKID